MFLDALGLLSDFQAVTVTAFSTNTIDLGNVTPKNKIGDGEPMAILVTVDVSADFTTTDETYAFDVVDSPNANLSAPVILARYTRTAAQLVAGSIHVFPVPPGSPTNRFFGLQYTTGGTTPTITVTSALVPQALADKIRMYAKGYTIS